MKKIDSCLIGFLIFAILSLILVNSINVLDRFFVLFSSPQVIEVSPKTGEEDVALNSQLVIRFDKPIKRQELQYSISPEANGEWKFEDTLIKNHFYRTLIFVPAIDFTPGTEYQVKLENMKGFGLEKTNSFLFTFKTQSFPELKELFIEPKIEITMLNIPLDWQDSPLSCEAASLKMALAGKGVFVSEKEIMEKIGYDLTPHKKNIWGNPYEKYVGDIDGKICETGYGVYWEPVARGAKNWREAEVFSGWKVEDLTREIKAGNSVIVWGALPVGTLTDCSWYTPEGKYILALKETHVRLAVGFIGPAENPSKIILNDPLAGKLYWSTTYFLKNWKIFNYSGVVVR